MKSNQGLFFLIATSSGHAAIAQTTTTYTCPATAGAPPTLLSKAIPNGPSVTVRIPIVSDPNGLCTLVRHNATSGGTQRAPVARSYASRKAWEVSAGLFANGAKSGLAIDCTAGITCDVTLPPLLGDGEEYILESFAHSTSDDATAARFLEQATFGSTRQDIDKLMSTNLNYEAWLMEQMYDLPASSLREFYRKRVNPKNDFSSFAAAVGSGPCDIYSRWRMYAISSQDVILDREELLNKHLTFEQIPGVTGYIWKVDGQVRTVTADPPMDVNGAALALSERYEIVNRKGHSGFGDCIGCPIYISFRNKDWTEIANPAISIAGLEGNLPLDVIVLPDFKSSKLPSIESSTDYPLFSDWIKGDENALLNTTSLDSALCNELPDVRYPIPWNQNHAHSGTFSSVFAKSVDSETGHEVVFIYDRHLTLYENTIENPLPDGGGKLVIETANLEAGDQVKCHNVNRNFYNEDHCTLSYLETACSPGTDPKEVIVLNDANINGIRSSTGHLLYAVKGLTISDEFNDESGFNAPCANTRLSQRSRWINDASDPTCENIASLGDKTYKIYQDMIQGSISIGDFNNEIVDVNREKRSCDTSDQTKTYLGKIMAADGTCWHHVHHSEMNVFDLTRADAASYTFTGSDNIVSIVSMDVFESHIRERTVVGKFGDHVEIVDSSPSPLDDTAVQTTFKTLEYNTELHPVLMCGSRGEIASDPFFGDHGFDVVVPESSGFRSMSRWELAGQKHTTWTHLALHAEDQLRMKMAWSLSQIVSVGLPSTVGSAHEFESTEAYLAFYDMFVNNGFGSYRKLMKEFSFSHIMADWLSFEDNRSLQYNIDRDGKKNYPDENFAREIMQLFSVGLYQLNMDGSIIYQENGNPAETYSIEDIVSYSRGWTGFVKTSTRGGAATTAREGGGTTLDPMKIDVDKRDWFPKSDLLGGFIGDKVARCADLAVLKHFIRKGATYKLLGASGTPELHEDDEWWAQNPDFNHLDIQSSSPLYAKLCQADANGDCTLPAKVVLDENLIYDDTAMTGAEYAVDTIRTVRMKIGSTSSIWYEYVRQPCVEHSFYRDAKRVTKGHIKSGYVEESNMCANPQLEAATPMCSAAGWETEIKDGLIYCHYQGERMTYDSAVAICEANGMEQSYPRIIKSWKAGPCSHGISTKEYRSWANDACEVKVKIAFDSGQIATIHSPGPDRAGLVNIEKHVGPDSINFFMVPWESAGPPTLNDCVSISSCFVHSDDYCICDTDTTENIVYSSSEEVSSIGDLMSSLHIGSVDPATFDAGMYTSLGDCGIQDVAVYSMTDDNSDCTTFSSHTIFAFEWNSKPIFLKNSKSIVSIPESSFEFRNPVQFISASDPEVRDAYYETDELLESLFQHPSHPPFLAIRVIQRFGISNPSPGFVERVATAYKTGSFRQFGSNEYGCLGAMVAAILLDEESRSVVLDADQTSGHLREPLIKVISFFRSFGLDYKSPLRIPTLMGTEETIGQGSFENPSVFSFFLPEFSPPGGVQQAGLVAPESMVLKGDNVLFLLDAYFSTVKFGVVDCYKMDSFESWRDLYPFDCPSTEGDSSLSPARLSEWPQSISSVDDILDELDVLLTSGRLQGSNRALIKSIVDPLMGDVAKAVRAAQQLILSTPEYHSTSLPRKKNTARESTGYTTAPKASYKAVVVLMMTGGVDSWNMLVPKGQCETADAYKEYFAARGKSHAIPKTDLRSIHTANQECVEYGVNKHLEILADLYHEGQALFMANTGVLSKPLKNQDNWEGETAFTPFAHNTMQEAFYTGDIYGKHPGTGVMGRILDVLKKNGLQTSANNIADGMTMLSGDLMFNNPVYTVSTKSPSDLNKYPTIENLIDSVKTLNGVGETGNSLMSEYWSSRVASSLFEHEQMQEIAAIPEFEVTEYPVTSVKLTSSFKAIAGYMKSRQYRKANRDVFVLSQGGFDMHKEDELHERFPEVNEALDGFIQELKKQDLWNSTVIVMGSDFGRSLNTNSNGGTDHAWGGNYFMAGGSLIGGQIVGTYPTPLGPDSDYWLSRGRWIPTTPWEAVWNSVAQWMGVHDDADLDWALPNRESFNTCDLFTDKDLFHDGACECVQKNNAQSTVCDEITYSPTSFPTGSPTTVSPTNSPSTSPTVSPTPNPTAGLPDIGWLQANILEGSSVTDFGCANDAKGWKSFDKSTNKFYCDRTGMHNTAPGIVVTSEHGQLTIPKAIRLYPANSCKTCDPQSFVLEGRKESTAPWNEIASYDFPSVTEGLDRNIQGLPIDSTYEHGDQNLNSIQVHFHDHNVPYLDYKLTFQLVSYTSDTFQYAEIEIPGMLLPPEPSASPTPNPTAGFPDNGTLVKTIFDVDSRVRNFGCKNDDKNAKAIDGSTNKFICDRNDDRRNGIIVRPSHSQLSIAKALRIYAQSNCENCDPVRYILEGRIDPDYAWTEIDQGDLPWIDAPLGRNAQGLPIDSTYKSADDRYSFTEVYFHSNNAAYWEYKLSLEPRKVEHSSVQFGEVELPGMLLPGV